MLSARRLHLRRRCRRTGAFVKISGWRSISIASASLVIAENPGKSGSATLRTGDSSRMRLAAACQRPGSA